MAVNNGNPYPTSRPFPAKFPGTCDWSGTKYRKGEITRRIIDRYDADTDREINPRYVRECFVNMACDPTWRRLDENFTIEGILKDLVRFILVDKNGKVKGPYTYRGERFEVPGYTVQTRSCGQMKQTFTAAVAVQVLEG